MLRRFTSCMTTEIASNWIALWLLFLFFLQLKCIQIHVSVFDMAGYMYMCVCIIRLCFSPSPAARFDTLNGCAKTGSVVTPELQRCSIGLKNMGQRGSDIWQTTANTWLWVLKVISNIIKPYRSISHSFNLQSYIHWRSGGNVFWQQVPGGGPFSVSSDSSPPQYSLYTPASHT